MVSSNCLRYFVSVRTPFSSNMCIRLEQCCCCSLRTATLSVAWYSTLLTIATYCLSGAFLYQGITYMERGEKESYDNDATFMMFGCLYLIFAAFWTCACGALFAAILSKTRWLVVPWLVLQVLSGGLGFVNCICQAYTMDYMALIGLPFILIGCFQFVVVYSYFMNMYHPPPIVLPYP